MKIGFSIWKFYHVLIERSDGKKVELVIDDDDFKYLSSLPKSENVSFVALGDSFNAIVERSESDKLDDFFNEYNYL